LDLELKGKVVVITGAARGIGRILALAFAREGAKVMINDIADGVPVEQEIRNTGQEAIFVRANIVSSAEAEQLLTTAAERFGRIDILINNAGTTRDALLHKMNENDWDDVIAVNLKGTFNCCRAAAKFVIGQKYGRILSISSVVGQKGNIGQVNYAASKAGIIGLTKTLALEFARYGDITVNAIAPGYVDTEMVRSVPEKVMTRLIESIPFHRLAQPEEIADLALFLASDRAKYITGQTVGINGGYYT
jgi:3-oxoacyl-[acyl-carrier protein] reductase